MEQSHSPNGQAILPSCPELPARPRHFVGRADEIIRLAHAFARGPGAMVWAPGGMGKTTLALEAAHRQAWRFPHGILWLPLSGGTVGFFDLLRVHLGLPPDAAETAMGAVLAHRQCLLLIDTLEDAPDREEALSFLAAGPPGAWRGLITMRELRLLKDWVLIELPELSREQGALLLRERLSQGHWTQADAAAANGISTLLGGHPLALELAAGLRRDFRTLAELKDALTDQRARLLADPALSGVAEKDRNLYYSFSLSFNRLTVPAQTALPKLGVLLTPWTDAAALAVTQLTTATWPQVRDELRSRSFLRRDGSRYWLHTLVRAFALQHLSSQATESRRAARHFAKLATGPGVTPQEALAIPTYWLAAGDWEHAADTVFALWNSLARQGYWHPILQQLEGALGAVPVTARTAVLRAMLLHAKGDLQSFRGDNDAALLSYGHGLALFRAAGDRQGEANTLRATGKVQALRGDREAALVLYGQALDLYRALGARLGEANTLRAIGHLQAIHGDHDAALESYTQALALARAVGDRKGEAHTLEAIGDVQTFRADCEAALESFGQALALHRATGNRLGEANALLAIGTIQALDGDHGLALASYDQALNLHRTVGNRYGEAHTLKVMGDLRAVRHDYAAALEAYAQALELCRVMGDRLGEAHTLVAIGRVQASSGNQEAALASYGQALALYRAVGDRPGEANTRYALARWLLCNGATKDAEVQLAAAVDLSRQFGPDLPVTHSWTAELQALRETLQQANAPEE